MTPVDDGFSPPDSWVPILHDRAVERGDCPCFGPVVYLTGELSYGEVATGRDVPAAMIRTASGRHVAAMPDHCSSCGRQISDRTVTVLVHRHGVERLEDV